MVQKTSRIGLAAILALMDWDFVTSLVSQAATQATLEVGDWKLAHKKETKNKNKQTLQTFSVVKKELYHARPTVSEIRK